MRLRAGSVLLVVQVGVSLMLLVSAGLLMQTFLKLLPADPGFDHSGFLTQFVLDEKRYPDDAARISFSRELLDNLEARPEIEAIALSSHIPFGWNVATVPFRLPGERTGTEFQGRRVFRHLISAGYFQVMGIPLLQGRTFSTADRGAAPPVAVVNEAFAQLLSPEGTVLGQTIFVEDNEGAELPREIVGVVANTRTHGRSTVTRESIYLPFEQQANRSFFVLLHSRSGLDALAPLLREQVRLVDPAQPVREVQAYDDLLWESVSTQRFRATLLGVFSAQALLVAVVGLFGLVSYSLAQRTPEFGVRLAVGADGRDLVRLLLRQGATLAAAGIALGAGASLFATRLLESQLYELSPGDPLTLAAAAGLLGLAALAACYLPARRAARIDPIEALRHE
jgi:putative ABC transport system permease protein